jgi:HEAT repeat protein
MKILQKQEWGWRAALSLGNLKSTESVQVLIKTLDHKNPKFRQAAVWALEKIATPQALKAIGKFKN